MPGDLVKVHKGEQIPADLIALHSPEKKGSLFVETKSLDGETNLKEKSVPKEIYQSETFNLEINVPQLSGSITTSAPNGELYSLQAKFNNQIGVIPLGPDNLLLRGSSLRDTEFVLGLVIYSGSETKIMMNSIKAKYKFSRLENLTSRSIMTIFVLSFKLVLGFLKHVSHL